MSLPIIAFDLDGTLVDTAPDLIATLNWVFAERGLPPVTYEEARSMIGAGVKPLLKRGLTAQGITLPEPELEALYNTYLERYAAHIADTSRPFPGLIAALDRLEADGYSFAVATNKLEWLSVKLLDELDLSRRFKAICGQDTFGVPKPNPEMLRKTIAKAGGDPARAIMVGDSEADFRVAQNAGLPVIAVDFGYTPRPVQEFGPDIIISHYDALPGAVAELTAQFAKV
ncbi:phosphoglycolate phosphatase [Variibacter gotjawalensis]|uniref:Phosphoglycolate phosphatase n=1 Tax=Variibacter gotjawalensis TaxID=1333996 RepID=A0A0S3PYY9_9BRAD|nr:HAD-IA family hydrolase [Variibacter gotjawalensis]NIK46990.1 phosphoglycolate phosphatase [Variibacter gotjawalensis]RZS48894.1 phosphoglycolate phosphatase [Variibacter gotjawalensis]BAT61153.1 phosphoglycolate phosphatase [Variibacter gotjawalensis]